MADVKLKYLNQVVVVSPQKDLVGYKETDNLAESLHEAIENGSKYVVVDLKKVSFMNSAGLGALIKANKDAKAAGSSMKLCNLNERNHHLIALVKLELVFDIYENEEEAIASFA